MRLLFAVAYLTIDLVYVMLSKSYYENVAKTIQGKGFPSSRWLGAVVAYVALVVGWWFFATALAHQFMQEYGWSPLLAGAAAGALYGGVVYGVFNGTAHVMFEGYTGGVFGRDLAWGMLSASLITACYAYYVTK